MFQLKKSYVIAWNVVGQVRLKKVHALRLNYIPEKVGVNQK
jgi:hypothetical protein